MKNILITGATGFIGRRLARRLLREGCSVHALTRNPAAARQKLPPEIRLWEWNPASEKPFALPEDISAVVHLAGETLAHWPWTRKRKSLLWRSRVEATRALVQMLEQRGWKPSVLVSASGMGYHGDAGDRLVHVGDAPGNDFLGKLASAWEGEALRAGAFGMRVVLPRFGLVLDAHEGALPKMARAAKLGLGARLGSGKQYWGWIHIDDLVELLFQSLMNDGIRGPVHAVAGSPVTQEEFSRRLAQCLRKPRLLKIPEFALKLSLGEMADLLLHGQKAEPDSRLWAPATSSLEAAFLQIFP